MSIELLPLGMKCQRSCSYCYQEPVREATENKAPPYDMDAMKAALEQEGFAFTLFGGEPLLVPIEDLEEIFSWGKHRFGQAAAAHGRAPVGIQTDGYLITDAHIRIFRRYGVGVGMSIDGPCELNDARAMAAGLDATRAATAASEAAMLKMLTGGINVSIITTLTRHNASPERLPRLLDWYRELAELGLRHVNLHLLEVDSLEARELELSDDEAAEAMLACARLQSEAELTFQPIADMQRLLRGEDQWGELPNGGGYASGSSCIWNGCDAYTTDAVRGVDGQGNRRNCGRTYKHGVAATKADSHGYERYLALYHTPQEYGGCAGCRFFYACKGNCPGTGEQGDWRSKTEHCGALMAVFGALEAWMVSQGEKPFSLSPERAPLEAAMLTQWASGKQALITDTRRRLKAGGALVQEQRQAVVDQDHTDTPHGDDHQDHTDQALASQREKEKQAWAEI